LNYFVAAADVAGLQ